MIRQKEAKAVLNKLRKRDEWFLVNYTVNPYEGCSCNCLYCYIRGSKYGTNMEDGLAAKTNVLEVLEKQLRVKARKGEFGFVAVGSATDAYLPHEENYKLTKGILELLLKYRFPVFISTKRDLVLRDIEILKEIDRNAITPADLKGIGHGVILSTSVSSLDENVTDMLEPAALKPAKRLELVRQLRSMGFLAGVNAIPLLPYISDTDDELERIFSACSASNAEYILAGSLTLFGTEPAASKTLYYKFLERHNSKLIPAYEKLYAGQYYPPRNYQALLKQKTDALSLKYGIRNSILKQ
jgi:DNA repair photolyase